MSRHFINSSLSKTLMQSVRVNPSPTMNQTNFLSMKQKNGDMANKSRLNFLKIETYPDRFSHIKTTRLEYPSQECRANVSETKKKINRRYRDRNSARYMTQPVTLIEIKEIEEDMNEQNQNSKKF
ncbi:hypothetical protein BpHYR1_001246 [Brachionus plicatilis]|uniref:Uncharacterized protein n=1 Tax=Brachionus plicatilis TaxID=10195 RepID=A0A3M7S4Y7_BRAPC|nr:hypothetical protein BpHYR1_001246 [Brachionus plicatilis]